MTAKIRAILGARSTTMFSQLAEATGLPVQDVLDSLDAASRSKVDPTQAGLSYADNVVRELLARGPLSQCCVCGGGVPRERWISRDRSCLACMSSSPGDALFGEWRDRALVWATYYEVGGAEYADEQMADGDRE